MSSKKIIYNPIFLSFPSHNFVLAVSLNLNYLLKGHNLSRPCPYSILASIVYNLILKSK